MPFPAVISTSRPSSESRETPFLWRKSRATGVVSDFSSLTNYFIGQDKAVREKFAELKKELNPEIRAQGLYLLGLELRDRNQLEAAHGVFAALEREAADSSESWAREIQSKTRRAREALTGQGSGPERSEFWLARLADSVKDPVLLFGFGAAGLAADVVKLATLSRLVAATPAFFTRGWRASLLANAFSFSAELPALFAVQSGLEIALGRKRQGNVIQEFADLAVVLGCMKFGGAAFSSLGRTPAILQQAGRFAGILAGQYWIHPENSTTLVDSLAFLLHANVGGNLSRRVMGDPFRLHIANLQAALRTPTPQASTPPPRSHLWAMASSGGGKGGEGPPRFPRPGLVKGPTHPDSSPVPITKPVFSQGSGNNSEPSFLRRRLAQRLQADLQKSYNSSPGMVAQVLENFQKTRFTFDAERMFNRYYQLLSRAHVDHVIFEDKDVTRETILGRAVEAFRYVSELNTRETTVGSLYEHLLQIALEGTVASEDQRNFNDLIRLAGLERTMKGLEIFLEAGNSNRQRRTSNPPVEWATRLQHLAIPEAAKAPVFDYLGRLPVRSNQAHEKFKLLRPNSQGGKDPIPWTGETALQALESYVGNSTSDPQRVTDLVQALDRAEASPARMAVVDRILKVLAQEDFPEKLREISGWEDLNLKAMYEQKVFSPLTHDFSTAAQIINGTIYTGFVDDLPLAAILAEIYSLLRINLEEKNWRRYQRKTIEFAEERLKERAEKDRQEWEKGEGNLTGELMPEPNYQKEEVLEILYHRPTPLALEAWKAISSGKLELSILSEKEIGELWNAIEHSARKQPTPYAFYVPVSKSPIDKPILAIRNLDPSLSQREKSRRAVYLGGRTTHEYRHHQDHEELPFDTPPGILRTEMRGRADELYYYLIHGYVKEWEHVENLSPYGLGMYLRNEVEKDYPVHAGDLIGKK